MDVHRGVYLYSTHTRSVKNKICLLVASRTHVYIIRLEVNKKHITCILFHPS